MSRSGPDRLCISTVRTLAGDAIQRAGHPGLWQSGPVADLVRGQIAKPIR